jgi:hypothetical protein
MQGRKNMPRKKAPTTADVAATIPAAEPRPTFVQAVTERDFVTPDNIRFQVTEDRIDNRMVFKFAAEPDAKVKERLKYYGYHYHGQEKIWTVNATSVTRKIAGDLANEFSGQEQGMSR